MAGLIIARNENKGNKEFIKLYCFKREPMTKVGYKQFPVHLRAKILKEVTTQFRRLDLPINEVNNKDALIDFIYKNLGEGKWCVLGMTHAKTKTHCKWVKICKVVIQEKGDSYSGFICESVRLHRYRWFYKG